MLRLLKPPTTDLDELSNIQRKVAKKVIKRDEIKEIDVIAGCDISFSKEDRAFAAYVLFRHPELEEIDGKTLEVKIDFPYIPTFLAFRELNPLLKVLKDVEADIYMVGAHGIAHPRRAGLASHLGVIMDKPTLGVAKGPICGESEEPSPEKGSFTFLKDSEEIIGASIRTCSGVNPVYVSIGHKISLKKAVEITLKTSKYRIPEPIRAAHNLATEAMREEFKEPKDEFFQNSKRFEYLEFLDHEKIITIDNVASAEFLKNRFKLDIIIIDFTVGRTSRRKLGDYRKLLRPHGQNGESFRLDNRGSVGEH